MKRAIRSLSAGRENNGGNNGDAPRRRRREISLDALTKDGQSRHELIAAPVADTDGNRRADALTTRNAIVARHIADGFSDKQIAGLLDRSEETIAYHVSRIARQWRLDPARNIRVQIALRVAATTGVTHALEGNV